jgi:hypothetical protein
VAKFARTLALKKTDRDISRKAFYTEYAVTARSILHVSLEERAPPRNPHFSPSPWTSLIVYGMTLLLLEMIRLVVASARLSRPSCYIDARLSCEHPGHALVCSSIGEK